MKLVFLVPCNCNSWYHPEKNSHTCLVPIFVATARGNLYIVSIWWLVGLMLEGPTGLQQTEKKFLNS